MTAVSSSSQSPPHIPLDLVSEILCRLPVKHLLQLCCVCKSWNSLISLDSNFARKQLSLSTPNKDRHHLIQSSTKYYREFLLSHSTISSFFTNDPIVTVNQFRHTLKRVLGLHISTCDGILCFAIKGSQAVLYNPFTRKSNKLPPLKAPNSRDFQNLYTLVYDSITGNYKIIAVTFGNSKIQVNIHTLGTRYWRRIQDFPCSLLISTPGIFVNDTVNWFAYDSNSAKVIVSLDLKKESYQKFSLPFSHFEFFINLGTLKGCLSILSQHENFQLFYVWIMKEYRNEKSWTKLFTIPSHPERCGLYDGYSKVLYISENNQLLMEFEKRGLVVYDSTNKNFSIPKMQNNIHDDEEVAPLFCVESLISPF
ncbi:F-box/kelch-repeat protein At3g23880-like [Vicia villosa]|uniref:F-box/kelch-repeat protein At3g23880-like n=1 Tax=Vicia villosa TaxID=3911 RepID=UPI00273BDFC8|nr:F-box/kelch-repeat protein At3g23880-like [Vicia villosa]